MAATSENSKPCKNDQAHKFTGKENSPKGIGYCANAESIGTLMEGRDKKLWMVTLKNGVKQWSLVPESLSLVDLKKQVPVLSDTIVMAKPVVEEEKNDMEKVVDEEKKVTKPRAKKETDDEKKVTKPRAKKEPPPITKADETQDVPAPENTEKTEKITKPRAKKEKVEKTVTVEEKAMTVEEKAITEDVEVTQKTKKPRAKKDADKPDKPEKAKKAPNVFNLFVQKTIPELKEQYPGLKLPEYMKMVSEAWKKEKDNVE